MLQKDSPGFQHTSHIVISENITKKSAKCFNIAISQNLIKKSDSSFIAISENITKKSINDFNKWNSEYVMKKFDNSFKIRISEKAAKLKGNRNNVTVQLPSLNIFWPKIAHFLPNFL